jgi:multidrug efflux pump subunit AcrA (membrane-fusion protein)
MADALMAAQQRFVDETNAVAAFVDQRALDSDSRATDSATSAAAAQQALTDARLARDAAQSTANFKGQWSGLSGSLALPATVLHNQQIWSLLTNLANVAASEPGVTGDWLVMGGIDASKTADFTAARNGSYWLGTTLIATLPDTTTPPPKGTFVRFTKALGAEPTIQTGAGNAVIQTAKGADTALLFDLDAEIIFVFNGTDWEI